MSLKIYIIGAATGFEPEAVQVEFKAAEERLKGMGFVVVNPINYLNGASDWVDSMKICIPLMLSCEAFYRLENYAYSKRSLLELATARNHELIEFVDSPKFSGK
jgi:hypothetical protein